jgi:hypothetical protein
MPVNDVLNMTCRLFSRLKRLATVSDKETMRIVVLVSFLLGSFAAHAGIYGELNGFFSTDTFATATTATYSKTFYALDIHSNLETKARFYAGFHVDQFAATEEAAPGSQATLTSLNMGPMGMWIMDHKKTFSLSAGYNVIATGSYTVTGSSAATLAGSGLWSA